MTPNELANALLNTLSQHLPPGTEWILVVGAAAAAALGLLLLVRGARFAPVLMVVALGGAGAAAGSAAAPHLPTPQWLPIVLGAVVAGALALVVFRILLVLLVCVLLVGGALSIYGQRVLIGPTNDYFATGLDTAKGLVTIPPATTSGPTSAPAVHDRAKELVGLWNHLSAHVPAFQLSVAAILIATVIAGCVFAVLLPKTAQAFWAATLGTVFLVPGGLVILHAAAPSLSASAGRWTPAVALGVWAVALLVNLADITGFQFRRPRPAPEAAPAETPPPARRPAR